jgi:hypothetical protein
LNNQLVIKRARAHRWASVLLALAALGLPGWVASAVVPASLVGEWQLRQVSFVAERPLSQELQEQLDDSTVAALNDALQQGRTRQVVYFRPDSTYQLDYYEDPAAAPTWTEAGTYRVAGGILAGAAPTSPNGSSFGYCRLRKLTARQLVLDFPFGADSLRIFKQLAYARRPAR